MFMMVCVCVRVCVCACVRVCVCVTAHRSHLRLHHQTEELSP